MRVAVLARRLLARPDGAAAADLLGRCELAALTTGLRLKATAGATVTVISAGPADREDEVLRRALAAGADRAVRVSHPLLATVDYHGIARVLAGAAKHVGYDLIVTGERSQDEAAGAVGPAVAEHLDLPHVSDVRLLGVADDGQLRVERRDAGGVRTLSVPLPALIAVKADDEKLPEGTSSAAVEALELEALGILPPELKYRDRCLGRAAPVRAVHGATLFARAADLVVRLRDERLLEE